MSRSEVFLRGCLFAGILSTYSCQGDYMDCPPEIKHIVRMDTSLRNQFPYNGIDTMYFLYNTADTVFYVGGPVQGISKSETDNSGGICNNTETWTGDGFSMYYESPHYRSDLMISYYCTRESHMAVLEILFKTPALPFQTDSYQLNVNNADSMLVAGKYVKDCKVVSDKVGNKAFYNVLYGLIKLEYTDGEVWERILR